MIGALTHAPRFLGRCRQAASRAVAAAMAVAVLASALTGAAAAAATPAAALPAASTCQLNSAQGNIKHVIAVQFDNTHFTRDNPNVPSDLEQMPHLLNFIKQNGVLLSNHHTPLISHTATDILTTLTGVYPDRMGQPVSNSFRYFTPAGTSRTGVAFAYWTSPLFDPAPGQTDFTPEMINEFGKIAPAPWAPFTRAGCDFGAVATANTILENTAIDIPTVFGPGSPEAAEVAANPGQAFADFVGLGIHCAPGSSLCSAANHGRPDLLPDEPGGYSGFNGLFGAKYVNPVIHPSGPMTDLNGNVIQDATGHIGFPGFDGMEATVTLAWVAQMQEAGVPVTYAYISDAHDGHGTSGNIHFAYGPGEAGYAQQLHDYDTAFGKFFDRLAADGINQSNTLFVFTVDEGDHFVGDAPTPAGCDGVTTPCNYNRVGEINADLRRMIRTQFGDTITFTVHADDAPTVYVNGNPGRTDLAVRQLERESAALSWLNPYTGQVETGITVALADPVQEKTLHMVTADPFRTPTFTLFADPNWFFFATGGAACATPDACASIPARTSQSFAWNHGDFMPDITRAWLGLVGPGVKARGVTDRIWSDHTDVRPTTLFLIGLKDDYAHDGRVLVEALKAGGQDDNANTNSNNNDDNSDRSDFVSLAKMYKRINAPVGELGLASLMVSTKALSGGSAADDSQYTNLENKLIDITTRRDALAAQMIHLLEGASFNGQQIDEDQARSLIKQGRALLKEVNHLAGLD